MAKTHEEMLDDMKRATNLLIKVGNVNLEIAELEVEARFSKTEEDRAHVLQRKEELAAKLHELQSQNH